MVGKRPNHAESALIAVIKHCGFNEGKYRKTFVKWNRRSLKRAIPMSGDFFANCIFGPFKGGGPYEFDLAFPNQEKAGFYPGGFNFEIDGVNWHKTPEQLEKDTKRDEVLKNNSWTVVRVRDDFLYSRLVPLLNQSILASKGEEYQ